MDNLIRLWAWAVVLLSTATARALVMAPLEIEQLAHKADLVVQGVVVSQTCRRDTAGRIFTEVEIELTEVWKGSASGKRLKVVMGGGLLDGRRTVVAGQVEYPSGEEVVGFFRINDRGEAVTIGLSQGKFRVQLDERTGEKLAVNPFHGAIQQTVAKSGAADRSDGDGLTLQRLKRRVQGAAR